MNKYIPLILAGVFLNSMAQLTIKQGMRIIGHFSFTANNILPIGIKLALNPFIALGMACYALSIIFWFMVLSRVEVSYAYPLLSVGYIVTAIAGYLFFNENITLIRLSGIFVICFGVYLITRSA